MHNTKQRAAVRPGGVFMNKQNVDRYVYIIEYKQLKRVETRMQITYEYSENRSIIISLHVRVQTYIRNMCMLYLENSVHEMVP